jgi:hypothetical protein
MPLADNTVTRVDIGDDWYVLRNELGFYEETIMLVDAVSPKELTAHKAIESEDKENNSVTTDQTPGEMVARRNLSRIKSYLVDWSYKEYTDGPTLPLTLENIKRISRKDSRTLLRKIEELEASVPEPFPGETTD